VFAPYVVVGLVDEYGVTTRSSNSKAVPKLHISCRLYKLYPPVWWTWCRECRGRWRSSGCSPPREGFCGRYPESAR